MGSAIQYEIGDLVFCTEDLFNDGGFPGAEAEALIVPAGARGVVVHFGHAEADERQEIYLVRFEDAQGTLGDPVGVLPEELTRDEDLARQLAS